MIKKQLQVYTPAHSYAGGEKQEDHHSEAALWDKLVRLYLKE
jgi:hypothetical protein